jgi:hypothetical protein
VDDEERKFLVCEGFIGIQAGNSFGFLNSELPAAYRQFQTNGPRGTPYRQGGRCNGLIKNGREAVFDRRKPKASARARD